MITETHLLAAMVFGHAAGLLFGFMCWKMPMANMISQGNDMEDVDRALGLAPLPLTRIPRTTLQEIEQEAHAKGVIPSAYLRGILLNRHSRKSES